MPRNGHDPTQSIVHTSYLTRWVTLWNGLYAIPGYVQIHACQSGRFSSCVKLQNQQQLLNFSYPPMLHTSYIMCEFTTYMWTFTLGKCLRHILPSLSLGRGHTGPLPTIPSNSLGNRMYPPTRPCYSSFNILFGKLLKFEIII